jgi:hypothetical protein
MKFLVAGLVVIEMLGAVAVAQQVPPPTSLYLAFRKGGPILSGTIAQVDPDKRVITLTVTEQLRGRVAQPAVTITYTIAPLDRRRPPMVWQRVAPVVGKRVVVLLDGAGPPYQAFEVLDLGGGDDRFLPTLRRMIELERPGADARRRLVDAVSDSSDLVRALAIDQLMNVECVRDLACKRDVLGIVFKKATDARAPAAERLAAVNAIGLKIYDGSSADAPINAAVLANLFELTTSPDADVRAEAVMILAGYLLGAGSARPAMPDLPAAVAQRVRMSLQAEARSGSAVSRQAGELLRLIPDR